MFEEQKKKKKKDDNSKRNPSLIEPAQNSKEQRESEREREIHKGANRHGWVHAL